MSVSNVKTSQGISSFKDILTPFTTAHFIKEYWEKELLTIERGNQDFYKSLFSVEDIDKIIDVSRPTGKSLRVVRNQEPLPPSIYENTDGSINLNQIYAAYADGYTVVINEIQRFWHPLKMFCQNMGDQLSNHTVANMYLTPKNQKALLPHYDTHDVYVLQIHGKKHWKLYDSPVETPLLNSHQPIFKREQLSNPKEVTLNAGDLMYMPRGLPHEAYTTDECSLHITIGVYPAQWLDLLTKSIQQMAQDSNPQLRKALPVGYLNAESWTPEYLENFKTICQSLVEQVAKKLPSMEGIGILSEEYRNKNNPRADGHFQEINRIDQLSIDSVVEKRSNLTCIVQEVGAFSRIVFPGNVIKGPSHIAAALQYIADSKGTFMLSDLPSISDTNKVKLAARLIRGGLLRYAD